MYLEKKTKPKKEIRRNPYDISCACCGVGCLFVCWGFFLCNTVYIRLASNSGSKKINAFPLIFCSLWTYDKV